MYCAHLLIMYILLIIIAYSCIAYTHTQLHTIRNCNLWVSAETWWAGDHRHVDNKPEESLKRTR